MRVLHLVKAPLPYAPWVRLLSRQLVAAGIEAHVALPGGDPDGTAYEDHGAAVHTLRAPTSNTPWAARRLGAEIKQLVAQTAPDLIHSHFVVTTLAARLALGRDHAIPRIFQVPGALHVDHRVARAIDVRTAGSADFWVACNQHIARRLAAGGVPQDRLWTSFYGVDTEDLAVPREATMRRNLGLEPDVPIVGMVGMMYPPKHYLGQRTGVKGHEDLIEAMRLVADARDDAVCVCVGGQWGSASGYRKRLHARADNRCPHCFRFTGFVPNVTAVYPDFDVVAVPSRSEGVPNVLVEAMALGRPCVATSVGGIPELLRSGENGWLVPPHDPPRLAKAILEVLADPVGASRIAARGPDRVRDLLDVRKTAAEVAGIYRAILSRH